MGRVRESEKDVPRLLSSTLKLQCGLSSILSPPILNLDFHSKSHSY